MKILFIFLGLFLITSCAHHRDVRPGANGIHRVVIPTDNSDHGARNAIEQANHYCEQFGKTAAIIEENNKYTGSMKEEDYKTAKTAAKVAQGVGVVGSVFGGKNERDLGHVALFGGAIADGAIGKGYTVEMKFKCQ